MNPGVVIVAGLVLAPLMLVAVPWVVWVGAVWLALFGLIP